MGLSCVQKWSHIEKPVSSKVEKTRQLTSIKFQRLKPHAADPVVQVLGFQYIRLSGYKAIRLL